MIDYYEPNIELTLLGCGFLGTYHIGAIYLLNQIWPKRPCNRICGASCGGLVGALFNSGVPLSRVLEVSMGIVRELQGQFWRRMCQLTSVHEILDRALESSLPPDAHLSCNGRLGLSVTRLQGLSNQFVSEFNSRRELIDAVLAGCFIPLWSGSWRAPKFRGSSCLDGAYTDNRPKFVEASGDGQRRVHHIEVCPFSCQAEVSPQRDRWFRFLCPFLGTRYQVCWSNISRSIDAMIPKAPINYRPYLEAGHLDMKNYILASDLVKCRQCKEIEETRRSCLSCLLLLERVDGLQMADEFVALAS